MDQLKKAIDLKFMKIINKNFNNLIITEKETIKDALIKINEKLQKLLINESLRAANGVKQDAAKLLGWGRNTLARKAKEIN